MLQYFSAKRCALYFLLAALPVAIIIIYNTVGSSSLRFSDMLLGIAAFAGLPLFFALTYLLVCKEVQRYYLFYALHTVISIIAYNAILWLDSFYIPPGWGGPEGLFIDVVGGFIIFQVIAFFTLCLLRILDGPRTPKPNNN